MYIQIYTWYLAYSMDSFYICLKCKCCLDNKSTLNGTEKGSDD